MLFLYVPLNISPTDLHTVLGRLYTKLYNPHSFRGYLCAERWGASRLSVVTSLRHFITNQRKTQAAQHHSIDENASQSASVYKFIPNTFMCVCVCVSRAIAQPSNMLVPMMLTTGI